MTDHTQTKEKIMQFLRTRGPSLPVHIAKEINLSILFTSAFLSELLSEKKIKISNLRVGSSPIYFIPGQESGLEKYSDNIKGKEKEAYLLVKEKKFLKDSGQEPAIRVALRAIKDFAIPFQKNNEIYWRYFSIPESEFTSKKEILTPKATSISISSQKISKENFPLINSPTASETNLSTDRQVGQPLDIFDRPKSTKRTIKKKSIEKKTTKRISDKKNEKFFNKIKEFLNQNSIEISGIEGFSKTDLTLKIRENNKEKLLIAYNKKRITETDIINTHKKASELNLPYTILSLGEPAKKIINLIEAVRDLDKIRKIE